MEGKFQDLFPNRLLKHFNQLFFFQRDALLRISLFRIHLTIVCIYWTIGNHFSFYHEFYPLLHGESLQWFYSKLTLNGLFLIKALFFITAFFFLIGFKTKYFGPAFFILYAFLNLYVVDFFPVAWSYNSHTVIFLFFLIFTPCGAHFSVDRFRSKSKTQHDLLYSSFCLAFFQIYIGFSYFQSFVSKLIYGGMDWFASGKTIKAYVDFYPTILNSLFESYPVLYSVSGIFTGIFEASILILLLLNFKKIGGILGFVFHLSVFAAMGISFWFLWWLFPPLFFYDRNLKYNFLYYSAIIVIVISSFFI